MMKNWIGIAMLTLILAACATAGADSVCDKAQFVEHVILDVPVQQGTAVMPGIHFTKTWEVLNVGTCDWTTGYALVFTAGEPMGAAEEIALSASVAVGESVDLSVRLTAPVSAGDHTGEWMLRNADGETFGVGPSGVKPLTVVLSIPELPAGVVYDFAQILCLARWDSGRAEFLPCEGENDEQGQLDGYVRLAPNGTIEVKPNNQEGGWIAGIFPSTTIQPGDHFLATVGCVDENPDCEIAFIIKVMTISEQFIIGNPQAVSGDSTESFDVDLSALAGQEISFILYMEENGGRSLDAIGYWLNARIENSSAPQ